MKPEEVRNLYDADYAAAYENEFLTNPKNAPDTEHEIALIGSFLADGGRWLDVACGTGFFLRQFPSADRTGIDMSPSMLSRAIAANPSVTFAEHDFRKPIPEWHDRFNLVSCMWYAYSLVDSVDDVDQLIQNLASWTSPLGVCFVPIGDPSMIAKLDLPPRFTSQFGGDIEVTSLTWSYYEKSGKVHKHLVCPTRDYMVRSFQRFFDEVEVVIYPVTPVTTVGRPAIVARKKRRV